MGWLQRMFGMEKPQDAQVNATATDSQVDPERVGLNGEYDESGLAKRVALAFDQDSGLTDVDTLWVAQTSSTVVLKGTVPSQDILDQMVSVAQGVSGATSVDVDQVTIG